MNYWTEEDENLLRRFNSHSNISEIAELLNRSPRAVMAKARALGLRKPKEYLWAKKLGRARAKLPKHEVPAVTDSELRLADQISDAEFRERIGMPELIGQPSRMNRGSQAYTVEGVE